MAKRLSKSDVRVRRRIMHHITRSLSGFDRQQFEAVYKDRVHQAVTEVLASERSAVEELEAEISRMEGEGGPAR